MWGICKPTPLLQRCTIIFLFLFLFCLLGKESHGRVPFAGGPRPPFPDPKPTPMESTRFFPF